MDFKSHFSIFEFYLPSSLPSSAVLKPAQAGLVTASHLKNLPGKCCGKKTGKNQVKICLKPGEILVKTW